jgi:acetyl esterase
MPLDPAARAICDAMAETFPPVDFARSGTENRRLIQAALAEVGVPDPEPVAEVVDRELPGPAGAIPVRVYRPLDAGPEPLAVAAFFHGGGWVVCGLDSHDGMCRAISNASGCVVMAVDYRLAPEHRFPAGVEDAYAAVSWLADHAAEIGGDPSRLAVVGDSAGGNVAAVVALMARDRGGPALGLQVLIYPVTDFCFDTPSHLDRREPHVLRSDEVRYYWYEYLASEDDGAHPYASPLRAETLAAVAPALVVLAEYDPLRDEGEAYAARLAADGVPTVATRYDGMMHSFLTFSDLPDAQRALRQIGDALQDAFALDPAS